MARHHLLLLLGCVLVTCSHGRGGDAQERAKLEGTWRFVKSPEAAGKSADKPSTSGITFRGESIAFGGEGSKMTAKGTYTVDPSKTPKAMDITLDKGGQKAVTQAIYDLDGDTLRICHYLGKKAAEQRPKQFMADKETVLGILKRARE